MSTATDTVGHRPRNLRLRQASSRERTRTAPAHLQAAARRSRTNTRAASRTADVLQVAASVLWIPQAGVIAFAVGQMTAPQNASVALWSALAVLLIGVARATLDAAGARMAFLSARKVLTEARREAAAALARRSPIDVARTASGHAGSVLAEQAEMIVPYLARYRTAQTRVAVVPALILACMLSFSWTAAAVVLIAAPIIPLFMVLIGWRAKEASEKQLIETGGMNAFLLDRLRGLTTIRTLDAVDATAKRLRADAESLRARTMAVLRIAFLSSAVLELFAALGVAMVAVYVGFHLLGQLPFGAWGAQLSLSEGLFILLLAPAFFEPLRELSAVWHDRAAGRAAEGALESLAVSRSQIVGADDAASETQIQHDTTAPSVRIENLTFRHAGAGADLFCDLNLAVAPGEHVALLGPSGCGKSTLLSLIAGLAAPNSGKILIGATTLSQRSAQDLRAGMAWIGQRPHIFSGTLASNVSLGRSSVDRDAVASALRFAQLDEIAAARAGAPIGENGQGLSGGEALRLALARIGANPQAGLILADEPTAHLDEATARDIIDALTKLARGKTMIIATHDPALAARMDRIVRLQDLTPGDAA